ncbi:DUF3093 domain-containing protein [Microbacterium dauci]|uniref:DUF3093 domain-containing protein n=1 Tax=Microbacterium dauci TaxID=3048008 RepID=A0ABT6ZHN2_9MICO|nr:DUF3093 domain-containing protein [Microbacterium sp. LX3-4]MDJ1115423.1 DUF3093 domain-containing protein [Microbacterium sp. LX3-4]
MHNVEHATSANAYRERLSPSLWLLVSAAVCAPMAAIVFVPVDQTLALAIGLAVGVAIVVALIGSAPVVSISGDELRVGRARIPLAVLGEPESLTGEEARAARGRDLGRDDWHLLRGGIDGVVRIAVKDENDPTTRWVFSSRTPERVAAIITRAQRGR